MPQVSEVVTRGARTVSPDVSCLLTVQAMTELNVGSLQVCDSDRLAGIVMHRDIVVRAVAQERPDAQLRDIMAAEPLYCYADEPVEQALETMCGGQVRRLPVGDRDKPLVGVLAIDDVAIDGNDEQAAGRALSDISSRRNPTVRTFRPPTATRAVFSNATGSNMVNQTGPPDRRPRKDRNPPSRTR